MNENLLRNIAKEAKKEGQIGLIIWANEATWEDASFLMRPGVEPYDSILAKITSGEEPLVIAKWEHLSLSPVIAVSVEELSSSDEFLSRVLNMCDEKLYTGPVTFIPNNNLSAQYAR